jgi:hypothetical protein
VIEPNNFPPAFAKILISIAFKASANFASATLASLCALCLGFQLILSLQMK